jgi:hypothetical protein
MDAKNQGQRSDGLDQTLPFIALDLMGCLTSSARTRQAPSAEVLVAGSVEKHADAMSKS